MKDTSQIARLVKCLQCSRTLQEPVTLPCGNTLCKSCIPFRLIRANISYPLTDSRLHGFRCPFDNCREEHAEIDCGLDVILARILEIAMRVIDACEKSTGISVVVVQDVPKQGRASAGALPAVTHNLTKESQLTYNSLVAQVSMPSPREADWADAVLHERLKEATRYEVDCQICYAPFLQPLTSACGHTLCRSCVDKFLQYSSLCPMCRQPMCWFPRARAGEAPFNTLLTAWVDYFFREEIASRIADERKHSLKYDAEMDTPLFVCTVTFPHVVTFLHISDPSHKLMIQRVVENGSRRLGMVLHNPTCEVEEYLGMVPFFKIGTLLKVINMQALPDGRSLLEAVGVSRFKVLKHVMLDGYLIGKVERVKDISTSEEEAIEAAETTPKRASPQDDGEVCRTATWAGKRLLNPDVDYLSTLELVSKGMMFIQEMKKQSASWLLNAHDDPPGEAALFPWWFITIVPASNDEKYRMLCADSLRGRLKLCMGLITHLEVQTW